jgi:uncharacterized membrane protein (UPF0127 family)
VSARSLVPLLLAVLVLGGCDRPSSAGAGNAPRPAAPPAQAQAPTATPAPKPPPPPPPQRRPDDFFIPTEAQHLAAIDLKIGGRWLSAEVARSEPERQTGLMYRNDLGDDAGMLFVFPKDEFRNFWMHDTPLPLSIAYIAADGTITQIADMKPYDEDLTASREQVRYALEVHRGWFRAAGVREGDKVEGLDRAGGGS